LKCGWKLHEALSPHQGDARIRRIAAMSGKQLWLGMLAGVMCGLCGCGGSAGSPEAQVSFPPPEQSVFNFLEAVRTGNDAEASNMLTPVAREKTQAMQLVVAPPGSDTASFEVLETELVEQDAAHVASKWTDLDDQGNAHTDEIVWILRLEENGWRIAGMGTKLFEDEPPLYLNFEDPEDMMRKQKLAEEEIMRRAEAADMQESRQARNPAAAEEGAQQR
jgi:hypothetical protein